MILEPLILASRVLDDKKKIIWEFVPEQSS